VPPTGRRDDRDHHIAAVIHHFLSDEVGRCPGSSAPPEPQCAAPARLLAVAAAGDNPTAAVAAGRLVAAATGAAAGRDRVAVYLRERPGLNWSAFDYLHRGEGGAARTGVAARYGGPRGGCAHLAGCRVTAGGPPPGVRSAAPLRVIDWLNCGHLTSEQLADLEGARRWREEVGCPVAGRDGLVWCLMPHEAGSRAAASALGRLAAICRPLRIVQLVFPAGWKPVAEPTAGVVSVGAPARRGRPPAWHRRCAALAEAAVTPVPVVTIDLGLPDGDGGFVSALAAGFGYAARQLIAAPDRRRRNGRAANDSRLLETC
jgi:hypothetical protein